MGTFLRRAASTIVTGRLAPQPLLQRMRLLDITACCATSPHSSSPIRWLANRSTSLPSSLPTRSPHAKHRPRQTQSHPTRAAPSLLLLPPPTVLYQSNHILAVYKPPGWHSIPHNHGSSSTSHSNGSNQSREPPPKTNDSDDSIHQKCLLTYVKQQQWGGGSRHDFIRPLHRIDQPCSGVLLLGKTTKAASRIQTAWQEHKVVKIYYVVVQKSGTIPHFERDNIDTTWYTLEGTMIRRSRPRLNGRQWQSNVNKGWSVQMVALPPKQAQQPSLLLESSSISKQRTAASHARHRERICTLEYRMVDSKPPLRRPQPGVIDDRPPLTLLQVRTRDGARHMIRALLASHGLAVMGDVRYGNSNIASKIAPLPDQSVALHAYCVTLPNSLVLGDAKSSSSSSSSLQRYFWAPIPTTWWTWFGWSQHDIDKWHEPCRPLEGDARTTGTP